MNGRRGWTVVGAAFVSAVFVYGVTHSFGVVFEAMAAEFGAGRGATAAVFSVSLALLFLLGLVTGPLADRYGPRPLALAGTLVLVAGLLVSARVEHLWLAYVSYGGGVGVAGACFFVPLVSAVGGWFERRRTLALGIAVSGIGAGTLVMPPIVSRLVESYGFRGACVALAAAAALLLPLCALAAFRPPRRAAATPARSLRQIARLPGFRPLYLSSALLTCAVIMLAVLLVPYARDQGWSAGRAALLVSLTGGASLCGRLLLSAVGGRWALAALYRACVAAIAVTVGALALAGGLAAVLVAVVLVFGGAQGGWVALTPAVTFRRYGGADAGRVLGLLYTGQGLGGFLGPVLAGSLIDHTGGYEAAILLAGAAALGAFLLLGEGMGSREPSPSPPPDPAPPTASPAPSDA